MGKDLNEDRNETDVNSTNDKESTLTVSQKKAITEIEKRVDGFSKDSHFFNNGSFRKNLVFADVFQISAIDTGKKKFDRVSRMEAISIGLGVDLILDFNSDLLKFPKDNKNTRIKIALSKSLSEEGNFNPDPKYYLEAPHWNQNQDAALADRFYYVMYGKVYRYDQTGSKVTVYISFGGLLMSLVGEPYQLEEIKQNHYLYLLVDYN